MNSLHSYHSMIHSPTNQEKTLLLRCKGRRVWIRYDVKITIPVKWDKWAEYPRGHQKYFPEQFGHLV